MLNISTSLTTILDRYIDQIIDEIAKDGLVALKRILDEAGFGDSEYLKDYEVSASVRGHEVEFGILLDFESVVPTDEITSKALETEEKVNDTVEAEPDAVYNIGKNGPVRILNPTSGKRDARTPARDARKKLRDKRVTAVDRSITKKIANISPRSARVTKDGKLSITLKRTAEIVREETVMPQDEFQGIIGDFMKKLAVLIATKFSPELSTIVSKNVG